MMMKKNWYLAAIAAAIMLAVAVPASAQIFSGRGVSNEAVVQAACLDEMDRLDIIAISLESFVNSLENCNAQGKVFDGVGCADLAGLEHEWLPNANNPTQLVLRDGATEVARIDVIRGKDGSNATPANCPVGTEPL